MEIKELHQFFLQHPSVVIDSRKAHPGSLFFGLRGNNNEGGAYAADALAKGCALAIVDKKEYDVSEKCILVPDALETLQQLASFHRRQFPIPVIGITGSNGKTTTKELVAAVLSGKKNVVYTEGNLNNHIGVPLTLLRINSETEIAVIEMGANHLGEIDFLCRLALPDFGIITTIGKAHLEGFGSFEGVIRAKTELYRFLAETGGTAFVNADNPLLVEQALLLNLKIITYGSRPGCDCFGQMIPEDPFLSFTWHAAAGSESHTVKTRLVGKYNFANAMAAICTGLYFGIPEKDICSAIEQYMPQNNRSQYHKSPYNELILDMYNANPSSMEAALLHFASLPHPRKVAILGDMLELGPYAGEEHMRILNLAASLPVEKIITVGPEFAKVSKGEKTVHFLSAEGLVEELKRNPIRGCQILIKGSRGMALEKVVPHL
ncbi:MAG TPA: UDP-N-acetylmuramoyl-tripeptide--D-alanyl-D-alanine ligase [Bacteroidales bacterium]|nr:UDP-N-acetylmuramoyl-tripeptide--D-alanyl-D-alanine ligase [Bacteroidales bacterium]